MGVCSSTGNAVGHEADYQRLVLLGPGGVGKSTLFRQVKLHETPTGFSDKDRENGADTIRCMLHQTLIMLLKIGDMQKSLARPRPAAADQEESKDDAAPASPAWNRNSIFVDQDLVDEFAQEHEQELLAVDRNVDTEEALAKLLGLIERYWQTASVRKTIKFLQASGRSFHGRSIEAYLSGNEWIQYWITNAARILDPGYVPTDDDMLKLRRPTTGTQELYFTMEEMPGAGNLGGSFCLVDVGGQMHEMKTWDDELEKNVTGIIFMVNLASFNHAGIRTPSRLTDAFTILDDLLRKSEDLQELPLVIMLNKVDLFRDRLNDGAVFREHVPDCPRHIGNAEKNIVAWLIEQLSTTSTFISAPHAQISCFATCATDRKMAQTTITNVVSAIIRTSLSAAGLY